MSGETDGWSQLAKNLKAEIDLDLIEAGRRIVVKIVDDRGIESLKIMEID